MQVSLISYSLPVLFIKKSGERIQFYVDYRKLNIIKEKDHYLIFLLKTH